MMSFQVAKGFSYRFSIVYRGKGAHNCYFCSEERTGVENSYHCMGVPSIFGRIVLTIDRRIMEQVEIKIETFHFIFTYFRRVILQQSWFSRGHPIKRKKYIYKAKYNPILNKEKK